MAFVPRSVVASVTSGNRQSQNGQQVGNDVSRPQAVVFGTVNPFPQHHPVAAVAEVAANVFLKELKQKDVDSRPLLKGLSEALRIKNWMIGISQGQEVYISREVSQKRGMQYQELARAVESTFTIVQRQVPELLTSYVSLAVPVNVVDRVFVLPTSLVDAQTKSLAMEYVKRHEDNANLKNIVSVGNQHFFEYSIGFYDSDGAICCYEPITASEISNYALGVDNDPHVRQATDTTSQAIVARYSALAAEGALRLAPAGAFIIRESESSPGSLMVSRKTKNGNVLDFLWKWDAALQHFSTPHTGQSTFVKNAQEIAVAVATWPIM